MSKNRQGGQGMPLPPGQPQAAPASVPAMPAPPSHEAAPVASDEELVQEELAEVAELQAKLEESQQALESANIRMAEMQKHLEIREQEFEKLQDQYAAQNGDYARLKKLIGSDHGLKGKKIPKPIKIEPLQVEALRAGTYGNNRRKEGDIFIIQGEHELGQWMKVLGPAKAQV